MKCTLDFKSCVVDSLVFTLIMSSTDHIEKYYFDYVE